MSEPHFIVRGIGGSHAHGLAHENSDLDYRGVFSYPTEDFFTLSEPAETITTSAPNPDSTGHELKKFLRLASKGNPDVLEVLAVDTYIDFDMEWGPRLLELTPYLLSTNGIRSAFMGYAFQQFQELKKRSAEGNMSFSAGMGSRTWKHAKHMFRLLETGERILRTGKLTPKVADRDWYLEQLPQYTLPELISEFETRLDKVKNTSSVIPDSHPDMTRINQYLTDYRKAH
jgi:predicted nucleotidyltransferase